MIKFVFNGLAFIPAACVFLFRERYQSLLDRIPRRLKALHTEAVAQRALDRRLTEEIIRIKASIQQLNMWVDQGQDKVIYCVLSRTLIVLSLVEILDFKFKL